MLYPARPRRLNPSVQMRSVLFALLVCTACSSDAPRTSRSPAGNSAAPVITAPSPVASASAPASPEAPRIKLETLLDTSTLRAGGDAMLFVHADLPEGLLVVAQMPPKAFLVNEEKVKPLPDFFAGLRSPAPDWPAEEFMISSIRGTLADLRFDIYAPATEYGDEVQGKPGKWKTASGRARGAKQTQPSWVHPWSISIPLETQKGAWIYEKTITEAGLAKEGFVFKFDGPAKGETLPKAAPGPKGCKAALLGHPLLQRLDDGSLVGLGTLCTSGDDLISTAKLNGVAPPFQSLGPRLRDGQLAVEMWKGGPAATSVVYPLPGAASTAEFAMFDLRERVPGELWVFSQINASDGVRRGYVARFDSGAWFDVSPPRAPEFLTPFVTRKKDLYLVGPSFLYRRDKDAWTTIRLERSEKCGEEESFLTAADGIGGEIFVHGALGCLWHVAPDAAEGRLVQLGVDERAEAIVARGSDVYVITSRGANAVLTRRAR